MVFVLWFFVNSQRFQNPGSFIKTPSPKTVLFNVSMGYVGYVFMVLRNLKNRMDMP